MNIRKVLTNLSGILHIFLVLVTVGFALLSLIRPDIVRTGIEWVGMQIKNWWSWNYLVLFFVGFLESFPFIGAVIPGFNIILLVGGFFIAGQWWLLSESIFLAGIGSMLGNASWYFLGHSLGKKSVHTFARTMWVDDAQLIWLEGQIEKRGFWFVFFGKFHNFTRSFMPYIAGAHALKGTHFWLANFLNSFLWAATVLLLGTIFIENYEIILDHASKIFFGLLAVFVIVLWFKNMRRK